MSTDAKRKALYLSKDALVALAKAAAESESSKYVEIVEAKQLLSELELLLKTAKEQLGPAKSSLNDVRKAEKLLPSESLQNAVIAATETVASIEGSIVELKERVAAAEAKLRQSLEPVRPYLRVAEDLSRSATASRTYHKSHFERLSGSFRDALKTARAPHLSKLEPLEKSCDANKAALLAAELRVETARSADECMQRASASEANEIARQSIKEELSAASKASKKAAKAVEVGERLLAEALAPIRLHVEVNRAYQELLVAARELDLQDEADIASESRYSSDDGESSGGSRCSCFYNYTCGWCSGSLGRWSSNIDMTS